LGEIHGEGAIALRYPDLGLLGGDYSIRVSVLSTQYDELPLHEVTVSAGIHVESKMKDGGGIFAMPVGWLIDDHDAGAFVSTQNSVIGRNPSDTDS
jgi:hypothetical protein